MARWITFDDITASELQRQLPQESIFEAPGRNALEYALNNTTPLVAVLPLNIQNVSAIALFRPGGSQAPLAEKVAPVRTTGFLGLNDAPVFGEEEEEVQEKKTWWQRLWKE